MDKAAEKKEKDKLKRQQARLSKMQAGMEELGLWLQDMLRTGLIALPDKPRQYWVDMDKRLVDAQASGMAGMVRQLRDLSYKTDTAWQDQAMDIIGRMWMVIRGFARLDQLPESHQADLKALAGWGPGPKDVLADPEALAIHDRWLVAARTTELIEDITTQRNWLLGLDTGHFALVINFAFKTMPIESPLVPGTCFDGELAFFPSAHPQRAVVRSQGPPQPFAHSLQPFPDWTAAEQDRAVQLAVNPLADNFPVFVAGLTPFIQRNQALLADVHQRTIPLMNSTDQMAFLNLLAISGGLPMDMLLWIGGKGVQVMGCVENEQYLLILSD